QLHHLAWSHLPAHDPGTLHDLPHAQNRCLWWIDDRGAAVHPEGTEIRHREGAAAELRLRETTVARRGGEALQLGSQTQDRHLLRIAYDGDDQAALGLYRHTQVNGVEVHDLVGIGVEMGVETRKTTQ